MGQVGPELTPVSALSATARVSKRSDPINKDHFFREDVRRAREPPNVRQYILMSTDGSDVARKGVKHGIALAAGLRTNPPATVVRMLSAAMTPISMFLEACIWRHIL